MGSSQGKVLFLVLVTMGSSIWCDTVADVVKDIFSVIFLNCLGPTKVSEVSKSYKPKLLALPNGFIASF